ncbi:hypothetical protein E7703_14070 [Citrobacter portucalensis]|uniref:hypothetical protein n=1 Tax=Citrobacter portucalensis TaxID=1639133 RepID=UPI0010A4A947|nr:hypothetical protein [Citrobacter portucalensis]QCD02217.1 hypothetical protein E7703_14070 [Citrobacter portucalensis]
MNFFIFILAIIVAVFVYRKSKNRSLAKGRSKVRSAVTAFALSFFSFIILLSFGSKEQSSAQEKTVATLKDSDGEKVDFDLLDNFQKSVFEEIKSMPNDTNNFREVFDRDRALSIFKDYGVRMNDFDSTVKDMCSVGYNKWQSFYKYETSTWLPLNSENYIVQAEVERREAFNKKNIEMLKIETKKMTDCFFEESQKLPQHITRSKRSD